MEENADILPLIKSSRQAVWVSTHVWTLFSRLIDFIKLLHHKSCVLLEITTIFLLL